MGDAQSEGSATPVVSKRLPVWAVLANVLVPPTGHLYVGEPRRGVLLWIGAWIVATLAGLAGQARLAGYAMFNLPEGLAGTGPWQRVINARGEISYSESRRGNDYLQRELLEAEGVEFDARGRVKLSIYGWRP